MAYFDNAATSFIKPPGVLACVQEAMLTMTSIGRGGYRQADLAAKAVYECRELAGLLFGAEPEQVVFTMNATHALNLAIRSLVKPGGRVVISGFEHNAVVRPLHALKAKITVAGKKLYDRENLLSAFDRAIRPGVDAVVCTQVSNVFGWRLPVEEIGALCRERGVPFVVDCAQSAGCVPVTLRTCGADFLAMPGHKGLYGPQGTGILICGRRPDPLIFGGTGSLAMLPDMPQELPDRVEAGTHNVPGICGLSAGLRFILEKTPEAIGAHEAELARYFSSGLRTEGKYRIFFDSDQTGVVSVQHRDLDCEMLAACLAARDIAVRAGLHCAPLAHRSAGTLDTGTVRISFSFFHTREDVAELVHTLRTI
ncbi:MAG: aminotransferase class V-fold PLP-dependent enzyme [Clostridia bacterium]|nr:aminotransferase class V-fold PLP-dependent enzyme [Clostridia bacterium]